MADTLYQLQFLNFEQFLDAQKSKGPQSSEVMNENLIEGHMVALSPPKPKKHWSSAFHQFFSKSVE